jgi:hypothetical protein
MYARHCRGLASDSVVSNFKTEGKGEVPSQVWSSPLS